MTGPQLGALIAAAGALSALTGTCGPWWLTLLRSRRRMWREITETLSEDTARRSAEPSSGGLFAIPNPEDDPT